jgi:hypothetical protein
MFVRSLRTALHAWRATSLRSLTTSAKPYHVFPSCHHTSRSSWLTPNSPPSRQSHGISPTNTPFHRKAENHQRPLLKNPPGARPPRFRAHDQLHARANHLLQRAHLGATPRARHVFRPLEQQPQPASTTRSHRTHTSSSTSVSDTWGERSTHERERGVRTRDYDYIAEAHRHRLANECARAHRQREREREEEARRLAEAEARRAAAAAKEA